MWMMIFSGLLVGLPAGFGVYMILNGSPDDKPSTGFSILLFAALLGAVFAFYLPEGKLVAANFKVKMPGVFVLGCVVGAVAGFLRRRRTGSEK